MTVKLIAKGWMFTNIFSNSCAYEVIFHLLKNGEETVRYPTHLSMFLRFSIKPCHRPTYIFGTDIVHKAFDKK